jgi:pyridoxal phosphate enzyme (YggS family)
MAMTVSEKIIRLKKELPGNVTLVAVSKTKPAGMVMEAYNAGQRDFGENYVQEMVDKHSQLPADIRWHFIGHLQSNKVKFITPFVHLIQGVDSLKLLREINKQALRNNRSVDCLLQVYIASEETKFGLSFHECDHILSDELRSLSNISVKGFMGMASNTANQEQVRREFNSLKTYHHQKVSQGFELPVLSYGMSGDYKLALECGSNMLRIGSTIFGAREYDE